MTDIYQNVTDRIVAMIEAGAGEWRMPWHGEGLRPPQNPLSGTRYRGINVPLLWCAGQAAGYSAQRWATYKQWQEAGAQVRRGEKSTLIFFWKRLEAHGADDEAQDGEPGKPRFVARAYCVFAAEQVDGYEMPASPLASELGEDQKIPMADQFFAAIGAQVRHGGERAFYSRSDDAIRMPEFRRFHDAGAYYATLGHEHVHWTGAPGRCAREFGRRFGDQAYAFEELVAELGAAFLCAELGISNEPRPDHAAYMASWLAVLKQDKRAIFTAGGRAQTAVDYLIERSAAQPALAA